MDDKNSTSDIKKYMEKQAVINVGTIGHVAHGKSTIVKCISGISTIKHKSELEKNITIKLGYANAKIYECKCERPQKYSVSKEDCKKCISKKELVQHVSFVDCPGHDVLMATMLNGTAIMDAALLLIAANESCPQPQTIEHLFAVEIMDLRKIIVLQNKIDLLTKEQSFEQCKQITNFLKNTNIKAPILPVSGQLYVNIDAVLDFLVNYIEIPKRNLKDDPKMVIIRSFDVNKPGTKYNKMSGAIIGGSIITGTICIGDEIEIRPGLVRLTENGFVCTPYLTRVDSLFAEKTRLEKAIPGGLIGVGTNLDPYCSKSDKLVGMVMGLKNKLPPVFYKIKIKYDLFEKTATSKKKNIEKHEQILLNISSTTTGCKILEINEKEGHFELINPCCVSIGERVAISRKVKNNWRLVGHGKIYDGTQAKIVYDI
ncbi:Eukaryotic [Nucleospora cyclopteri]